MYFQLVSYCPLTNFKMARSPSKRKKIRKCVVRNCSTKDSSGLHCFPKDPEKQAVWLKICGLQVIKKDDKICNKHFSESDYTFTNERKRLICTSVPSLNLPLQLLDQAEVHQDLSLGEIEVDVDQPMQDISLTGKY